MAEVSASILNIKNEKAIATLYNLEAAKINYFHIDVMDGKFVENNTVDKMLQYSEYLNSISNLPLDVHLMVEDVETYISSFLVFEPNIITFHLEAAKSKEQVLEWIKIIKENNVRVGLAVKPDTKIEEVKDFLPYVHLILVMTVEPGKGGQPLIVKTLEKIHALKQYVEDNNIEVDIEADGGINLENSEDVKRVGTDILVVGTALVNSDNYEDVVRKIK